MASNRWDLDLDESWILTPIAPCSQCGQRFVEDPTRDGRGDPIPLPPEEEEREPPMCDECQREVLGETIEADWLTMLERALGLKREDKAAIQALKYLAENPERVYLAVKVHDRVNELERRLEDRTASIRDAMESRVENADTRAFVSSVSASIGWFVAGAALGVVGTLLFGG